VVLPEAEDWGQAELYDHSTLIFTLNAATAFSCGAIDMSEANVAAGFEYATAHTTRERDLTNALRAMLATSETAQKSGKPLDEKVISEAAKVLASN
jgi:hypothetical protein